MAIVEKLAQRSYVVSRDPEDGITHVTINAVAFDGISDTHVQVTDTLDSPADAADTLTSLHEDLATAIAALDA